MKKGFVVFLRVFFVLLFIGTVAFFGFRSYYLNQSANAISEALVIGDAPVIGEKSLPFPIVEFFDYQCPHCSAMSALLNDVVDGDHQTKIILRPVALSGQEAFLISAFVLAAEKQGSGYSVKLHKQIMSMGGIPDFDAVKKLAVSLGIDVSQAEEDSRSEAIGRELAKNTQLVRDVGFYAVPSLIIGDKGYLPRDGMPGINELKMMILDAKTRLNIQNTSE